MRSLKRFAGLLLALLLCFGVVPASVLMAEGTGGLDNFTKKNIWTDSLFEDVAETDWFCDNVRSVYEYGLMVGKGEGIFDAAVGDLFVIRVAGYVLDRHQLGSVEYAVSHLGCGQVVVMGHTGCGAVHAAIGGEGHGYIKSITDEILKAVGTERDPDRACRRNTDFAVRELRQLFPGIEVTGAIYDIRTGEVEWLPGPTQESSL